MLIIIESIWKKMWGLIDVKTIYHCQTQPIWLRSDFSQNLFLFDFKINQLFQTNAL